MVILYVKGGSRLRQGRYNESAYCWLAASIFLWSSAPCSSRAEYPNIIDFRLTNPDALIIGAESQNGAGKAIATGDFNGDGALDLAIASPTASPLGREQVGEIDILWGGVPVDSLVDLVDYSGPISRIFGKIGEKAVLTTLNSGDHNRDGFDDLAIGLPLAPFPMADGKIYLIFGADDFPDTLDLGSPTLEVSTLFGPTGGFFGLEMTTGDVNGDTYEDLLVGAPAVPTGGGNVYIVNGRSGFPASMNLNYAPPGVTRIIDPELYQSTGRGLACGDVNTDGYDDILIGSPGSAQGYYQGKGTVLYGSSALPDTIFLSDPPLGTKLILPEYSHGMLGWRVEIGDINHDSFKDFVLSAYMADPFGCENCGEVYVIHGNEILPDTILLNSEASQITRLFGEGSLQHYGVEMTCVDVTGDGYDDIIVSSDPEDGTTRVPKVIVFYGGVNQPDSVFLGSDTTITRIFGESHGGNFGHVLSSGDFNGDVQDLVIGAPYADVDRKINAGKVYVLFGIGDPSSVLNQKIPQFVLQQNYPNPFSSETVIPVELNTSAEAKLSIYNVAGRVVDYYIFARQSRGGSEITWDGRNVKGRKVASGIYFYQLTVGNYSQTKKMILLR